MKKRTLGNGQTVSAIGLGCMGMNHAYGKPAPREAMVKLLHHAVDLGCTFFDTAVVYGEANEELLGEAFSSMRDQVVLATKFGIVGQRSRSICWTASPRPFANRWKVRCAVLEPTISTCITSTG